MSTTNAAPADLAVMLNELGLSVSALRWRGLLGSPEYSDFTPEQLLREVIEPQYIETMNNRYKTTLRLSRLIDKSAIAENLVTYLPHCGYRTNRVHKPHWEQHHPHSSPR